LGFLSFNEFSTQFPNTISKASTLCRAKLLSQEDSKFVETTLQGVREVFSSLKTL
jgi:hypothetical protein